MSNLGNDLANAFIFQDSTQDTACTYEADTILQIETGNYVNE